MPNSNSIVCAKHVLAIRSELRRTMSRCFWSREIATLATQIWVGILLLSAGALGNAQTCTGSAMTTITGTVYAPNGIDPLPQVLVYVPGEPVAPFTNGVACDGSAQLVTGSPIASAITAVDGSFTLVNVPSGTNIPLVIQIGRWRRQVVIPSVTACVNTAVQASLTHFPTSQAEGDIPKVALVTGSADGLECVLRKIGIADSEFTDPIGSGRINIYLGAGSPGAAIDANTPSEAQLEGTQSSLNQYNQVMFACQGGQYDPSSAFQSNLIVYANAKEAAGLPIEPT